MVPKVQAIEAAGASVLMLGTKQMTQGEEQQWAEHTIQLSIPGYHAVQSAVVSGRTAPLVLGRKPLVLGRWLGR